MTVGKIYFLRSVYLVAHYKVIMGEDSEHLNCKHVDNFCISVQVYLFVCHCKI